MEGLTDRKYARLAEDRQTVPTSKSPPALPASQLTGSVRTAPTSFTAVCIL